MRKDILKLVNALIANTKGDGEKAGEDFWVKSERLLFCALIGYLWYEAPEDEQNFTMLLELINAFEVREEDETFKNAIDLLFDDLARDKPDHFAIRQYAKFKLAAGKTAKSILISCGARLAPFDIAELRDLLAYDEMELDMRLETTLQFRGSEDGAVHHRQRHRLHLQLRGGHDVQPAVQPAVRPRGRCARRQAAVPCAVPAGRVCQHRADPHVRQADRHDPKPGDVGQHHPKSRQLCLWQSCPR